MLQEEAGGGSTDSLTSGGQYSAGANHVGDGGGYIGNNGYGHGTGGTQESGYDFGIGESATGGDAGGGRWRLLWRNYV